MNATKQEAPERQEIEELLPWHAAGTLSRRDAQRVEEALAQRPRARAPLCAGARRTRRDHSSQRDAGRAVGACAGKIVRQDRCRAGARQAVDASLNLGSRIAEFFASLTPRTLALAGGAAVLAILRAGRLHRRRDAQGDENQRLRDRVGTDHGDPGVGAFTLIRFAPQASSDDVTKFLEANKLSIASGPMAGGLYKVRVAVTGIPKAELARIVKKLQEDKVVGFIATTD